MGSINVLTKDQAPEEAKEIFESITKKVGRMPNIYAGVANSPSTLKAFLEFRANQSKGGRFSQKEAEAISLAIGQENQCTYCLAAHTVLGKMAGFSEEDTIELRKAQSDDPKLSALAKLSKEIVATKGRPSQEVIDAFFKAGYDQAALVELIGHVSANIFTNYFNHIADTPIDFPVAKEI
ncbi:carboxymuconolactone decarboxylase family protein [Thermoproteota archaeon]